MSFKKGDRVRLTDAYLKRLVSERKRASEREFVGTVVNDQQTGKTAIPVQWDTRQVPSWCDVKFLEQVRRR